MLTFLMDLEYLIARPKSDTIACCRYMPIGGGGGGGGGGSGGGGGRGRCVLEAGSKKTATGQRQHP
jgi:hypothetical protein